MQTTILTGCRKFKCNNNKAGQCLLAKVNLQDDGTSNISRLICIEAEEKPDGRKTNSKTMASSQ